VSISARLSYVRSEDLLDEEAPSARAPRLSFSLRRQLAGLALAAAALPLLTWALSATDALSLEGEVMLYLLAVVVVALVGGVLVALGAAVAAALLINWAFVAPRHTLDVAHADQAVSLAVFVAVAGVVSGAVELAARRARSAEQAARQAETLSALAGPDLDGSDTLRGILERARHTFDMESVALLARDRAHGTWHDVERAGWGERQALRFDLPIAPDLRLVGRGPALFAEDQRVLQAFAAAAQTAYAGRRLSARAREAQSLAAVDRQRTALLASVGHDLRTPLAAIKASSSTLRQTDVEWTAQDRDELLATIEESADRLDGIVGNLLDASRLEAGAVSVHTEPLALDEAVGAAVLAVPHAPDTIHVDVPEDLPLVHADPGLLERVLVNLVDNAIRHGGGSVELRASAGSETAKLMVIDHGPGVDDEQRERLFVPFQRLGDGDRTSGVGLGLAVAKGLTEAMGGALVADGSPGHGLTMRLRLPLAGRP
jgi:two-component system sensor histidine kinase KdpD